MNKHDTFQCMKKSRHNGITYRVDWSHITGDKNRKLDETQLFKHKSQIGWDTTTPSHSSSCPRCVSSKLHTRQPATWHLKDPYTPRNPALDPLLKAPSDPRPLWSSDSVAHFRHPIPHRPVVPSGQIQTRPCWPGPIPMDPLNPAQHSCLVFW